jgi:hypothetical protein
MLFLLLLLMVLLSHFFFPFFYLFLSFSECFLQNKLNSLSPFAACSFFSHFLLYSFFRSFDEMHPCSSNTIEPPGLYILFKSSIRDFFGQAEGAAAEGERRSAQREAKPEMRRTGVTKNDRAKERQREQQFGLANQPASKEGTESKWNERQEEARAESTGAQQ